MSTPIHNIEQISCSLFVGQKTYIYSFEYDYDPNVGTRITIYFVNESGIYNIPTLSGSTAAANILSVRQKTQITIGKALFSMYPVAYELDKSVDRRILKVEFEDDTFRLNNYYIVLFGSACGENVYALGQPVDPRTDAQRVTQAADPLIQNIKNQAVNLDLEYHFSDFLAKLRLIFNITVNATWDDTITKAFTGSFREVLDNWCQYHNLVCYFEESRLIINNPLSLNITFPVVPADALSVKQTEDLRNTFTATSSVAFKQDGGEFNANGVTSTTLSLYPVGAEFDLPQQAIDMNQVAAAAYGQEYWLVYNYLKGTADTECGWTRVSITELPNASLQQSIAALVVGGGGIASLNTDIFNQRFQFYSQYGSARAGRYYLSNDQAGAIYGLLSYRWYNQTNGQFFNLQALLNGAGGNPITLSTYLDGVTPGNGYLPDTPINRYYQGVLANGNRFVYEDPRIVNLQTAFNGSLSQSQLDLIHKYFLSLTEGLQGSSAMDYSQVSSDIRYVVFQDFIVNTTPNFFPLPTADQLALFQPSNTILNLVGVKSSATIQTTAPNGNNNIGVSTTSTTISNINTLTTLENSDARIYFTDYASCASYSSLSQAGAKGAYGHRLNSRIVSPDIPILFSVKSLSNLSYNIIRDLSYLQIPVQGGPNDIAANILVKTSTPQLQSLKKLTFTLNYFSPTIPLSRFVSNGLTSLSVSISEQGLTATYEFSNSMLHIPDTQIFEDKLALSIRNSILRQYNPQQSINF